MKDILDRMQKALGALAEDDTPTPSGVVKMSPEKFLGYATEQVEKAAKDKPEIRKARLAHLRGQVAAVAKNFEGQVPAEIPVSTFKDPDQKTTTSQEENPAPQNQSEGLGNFASNDPGPAKNGVGSPLPGGSLPGAGDAAPAGSGAPGYPESFAKAFASLAKQLEKLGDAPAPAGAAPAPAAPAAGAAPVEKSIGVIWPNDMNGSFGRGLADGEGEPEWGFDKGSEPAKRAETRKAADAPAKA